MVTGETCLSARPSHIAKKAWWTKTAPSPDRTLWFGADMNGGTRFSYGAGGDEVQTRFLRLLSKEARQNITFHCRNTLAYGEEGVGSLANALVLKAANGQELRAQGDKNLRYAALTDGCSKRDGQWRQTVVEYSTRTPARLPIADLAPMDLGRPGQEFGLDIGPVCFS